jgi:hypothetical protein
MIGIKDPYFMASVELLNCRQALNSAIEHLENNHPTLAAASMRMVLQYTGNALEEFTKDLIRGTAKHE